MDERAKIRSEFDKRETKTPLFFGSPHVPISPRKCACSLDTLRRTESHVSRCKHSSAALLTRHSYRIALSTAISRKGRLRSACPSADGSPLVTPAILPFVVILSAAKDPPSPLLSMLPLTALSPLPFVVIPTERSDEGSLLQRDDGRTGARPRFLPFSALPRAGNDS